MAEIFPDGIWPPHKAFYAESMLHCTTTALLAAGDLERAIDVGSAFDPSSREWHECSLTIVNSALVVAMQAAAISRYFWPVRDVEPHRSRAAQLRADLNVLDSSPLKDRRLRNRLEHFDENLDKFCRQLKGGAVMPGYVGPWRGNEEVPTFLFRAYYTDLSILEILGDRLSIQPIINELTELHDKLNQYG